MIRKSASLGPVLIAGIALGILSLGFQSLALTPTKATSSSGAAFVHFEERLRELNVEPYLARPATQAITVAVFDLDFTGWSEEKGKTLPQQIEYRPGPHPQDVPASGHGLAMAQLVWATYSQNNRQPGRPIKMLLYHTPGYSQLKWATEDAIQEKADVILYAQVWEFGSNFDGKGFLNQLANQAIAAGITWVNAAGNFGSLTYNDFVSLKGTHPNIEIECQPVLQNGKTQPDLAQVAQAAAAPAGSAGCAIRLVLSWNDFNDDPAIPTTKDLDLDLVGLTGQVLQSSHLRQVGVPAEGESTSQYAREMIETNLPPGRYFARVTTKGGDFTSQDRFRLVVSGNGVSMPGATADDSVLPPADNPDVLTVSAADSDLASWSQTSGKPDFWTNSRIETQSQADFIGSSNSAALVAGAVAVMKSVWPKAALAKIAPEGGIRDLKLADWQALIDLNRVGRSAGRGPDVGVYPVGGGSCFPHRVMESQGRWLPNATLQDGSPVVQSWITEGAAWVNTSQGTRLIVAVDPATIFATSSAYPHSDLARHQNTDAYMIETQTGRVQLVPRVSVPAAQRNGLVEVLQLPDHMTICGEEAGKWRNPVDGKTSIFVKTGLRNGQHSPFFSLPAIEVFDSWVQ